MNRLVRLGLIVLAAGALDCSLARADTIAITGGFVDFDVIGVMGPGAVHVSGDRGFSYDTQSNGFTYVPTGDFEPLVPGTTASLHASASDSDAGGTLRLDGVTYTDIGGPQSLHNIIVLVDAQVPLPSVASASAVVTAPFVLNIDFSGMNPDGSGAFAHSFAGSGSAVVHLTGLTNFGFPTWRIAHLHGELTPTPEPSTLVLIGSAGALAIYRRRRLPA